MEGRLGMSRVKLSASRLRYCTPGMREMLSDVQIQFRGEVADKNGRSRPQSGYEVR